MSTPDEFKLTIPFYQPASADQFDATFRAIGRRVNDLPFPQVQINQGNYSSPPTFTNASPLTIDIYPSTEIPEGYTLPFAGIMITEFAAQIAPDVPNIGNNMVFHPVIGSDMFQLGPFPRWAFPDGAGTCRENLAGVFYHLVDNLVTKWQPQVKFQCSPATGFILSGWTAIHTLWPNGLWDQWNNTNLP